MKKTILFLLLCCCCFPSASGQSMFGVQLGLGRTMGYTTKTTPSLDAYYLHRIVPGLYAGGMLSFRKYNLEKTIAASDPIQYGDLISINQKSSYIFLAPRIDYGIGYRQYLHIYATMGAGIYTGGHQWSNTHEPYWTPPGGTPYGADTVAVNTTYNIPSVIPRLSFGLSERIPLRGFWNIMLSQEFGMIQGSLSKGATALPASYFVFSVGIMQKYPHVLLEY